MSCGCMDCLDYKCCPTSKIGDLTEERDRLRAALEGIWLRERNALSGSYVMCSEEEYIKSKYEELLG